MNVKLLRRIQEKILAEPRQFNMGSYFLSNRDIRNFLLPNPEIPNCGTAACIAGWALALASNRKPSECEDSKANMIFSIKVLDLDIDSGRRLFHFVCWPEVYQLMRAEGTKKYAEQAVARIDHFIKTKGAQ